MKYHKILLSICIFFSFLKQLQSQEISMPIYKSSKEAKGTVQEFVYNSFHKDYENQLYKKCTKGYFFIQFVIDEKGNVADIKFNTEAPDYLLEPLKTMLTKTNGFWTPSYKKKKTVKSNPFLLPVGFDFTEECGTRSPILMDLKSLLNMTRFDSTHRTMPHECILLQTIILIPGIE